MAFQVKLHSPNARIPTRGSKDAAGYDLYSVDKLIIPPHTHSCVATGISIAMPDRVCQTLPVLPLGMTRDFLVHHYTLKPYWRIAPRSGLAAKHSIDVGAGVVDLDFRGEIKVVLFNHSDVNFEVNVSDRIAQIIPTVAIYPVMNDGEFVEVVGELSETERGSAGFGSTGV